MFQGPVTDGGRAYSQTCIGGDVLYVYVYQKPSKTPKFTRIERSKSAAAVKAHSAFIT